MKSTPPLDIAGSLILSGQIASAQETFATNRPLAAALTRAPFATAVDHARPLIVPGPVSRAAMVIGDLLAALGIVLCVPVVILAIGIPIALCVRVLLWIAGML